MHCAYSIGNYKAGINTNGSMFNLNKFFHDWSVKLYNSQKFSGSNLGGRESSLQINWEKCLRSYKNQPSPDPQSRRSRPIYGNLSFDARDCRGQV